MVCVDYRESRNHRTDDLVQENDAYYSNSFSSKWGNSRTYYCSSTPGRGYHGEIANFRVDTRPRRELRLNFSKLKPKTVFTIVGKLFLKILNLKMKVFLAAFLSLYKKCREGVLTKFQAANVADDDFLTPSKVKNL